MRGKLISKKKQQKLAASLRSLREEYKYTQQQVADWLCVDRSVYTGYELAKNLPNVFVLERIAELHEISIDEIVHNPDVEYLFQDE